MPKHVERFRCRIGQSVDYVSDIINDAEQFAIEIGVPRREMLFIFIDQCLGRCECASPQDRTALQKFLAQREKASRGDLSARMQAFWNPIMDDEDELLDGPPKRPYWSKDSKLAYDCPTPTNRCAFQSGELMRVFRGGPEELLAPAYKRTRR